MIIELLSTVANFFIRILEGLLAFLREFVPLLLKTVFVASPFFLLIFTFYKLGGFSTLVASIILVLIVFVLGLAWASKLKRSELNLSFSVVLSVVIIDTLLSLSLFLAPSLIGPIKRLTADIPHQRLTDLTIDPKDKKPQAPTAGGNLTEVFTSLEDWISVSCNPEWVAVQGVYAKSLTLSVEAVKFTKNETVLRVAVRAKSGEVGSDSWLSKAIGSYVIDASGTRYDLLKEKPGLRDPRTGRYSDEYTRRLMPNEVYRFELIFARLPSPMPFIYLRHPNFGLIKISPKS